MKCLNATWLMHTALKSIRIKKAGFKKKQQQQKKGQEKGTSNGDKSQSGEHKDTNTWERFIYC